MNKKSQQLGMNPSTAQSRLVRDLLFKQLCDLGINKCYRCGEEMSRDTFTIEHIKPWLDSEDPQKMFFDLDNISYSHHKCNSGNTSKISASCGTPTMYRKGCRCDACKKSAAEYRSKFYSTEKRSERYRQKGY